MVVVLSLVPSLLFHLKAPYVAGQLEYCINHSEKYTSVLLGFNPVELARYAVFLLWGLWFTTKGFLFRKVPISNWDKTFHDSKSLVTVS